MKIRSAIVRGGIALLVFVGLMGPATLVATGQEASPVAAPQMATPVAGAPLDVPLVDASGAAVGLATFSEDAAGVTVTLLIEGLTPGEHGWHLHEMGVCDPGGAEPFDSAGEHWNPTAMMHGGPADPEHHAGDFGNLTASQAGLAEAEITTTDFSLGEGPTSVFDEDGAAIIVHAGMDDLTSQPSGDSGARFACGVVAAPMTTPAAAPSGMATPIG
jgi:Cu-Zn family superoxide dismutase